MPAEHERAGPSRERLRPIVNAALIGAATVSLVFVLWTTREALLLTFAASIFATFLLAAARPIEHYAGLPHGVALGIVGLTLVVLAVAVGYLLGDQLASQASELQANLPIALQNLQSRIGHSLLPALGFGAGGPSLSSLGSTLGTVLGPALSFGTTLFGVLSSLVLVIAGGFYFAGSPGLYQSGLVRLFPAAQQDEIGEALRHCGEALRLWLLAQLLSMALIGLAVGIGTWLLGLPAPLGLGVLAGLFEFIPILGAVLGAVPALLLAATVSPMMVVWTLVMFTVIQQLEANVLMPIVQRGMVEIPPALLLFAVLAVGLLFGMLGVLLAAPLTVVVYVLVKQLYLRDTLGQEVSIPGSSDQA